MTVKTSSLARMSAVVLAAGLAGGLVGCTQGGSGDGSDGPETSTGYDPQDQDSNNGGLSMEQAGTIATDEYGGTITSIENDDHNGDPAWAVTLEGSSKGQTEVTVSKATGQILDVG